MNAKNLGGLLRGPPAQCFLNERFRQRNLLRLDRLVAMLQSMRLGRVELQILGSVVAPNLVLVMHDLFVCKQATPNALHHETMLTNRSRTQRMRVVRTILEDVARS